MEKRIIGHSLNSGAFEERMRYPPRDTYKGLLCQLGTGGCRCWTGQSGQLSQYKLEALHPRFCACVLEMNTQERNNNVLHGDTDNSSIGNVWMFVQNGF